MSKPNFLRLVSSLCVLLGLLLPAQVACPQNAVQSSGETVTKPKAVAPAPEARQADKQKSDERVTIENADRMSYDPDTKTYHLTGNVVFADKQSRLYCDQADYNEEADTAKATVHLRATDPDSVITGDLMEADFGKKLTVVTGNVTIVSQKKKNKTSEDKPPTALAKPGKGKAVTGTLAPNTPT
ncbi:MAG: OstA-like protein, partial [Armatimonadota bacterium]